MIHACMRRIDRKRGEGGIMNQCGTISCQSEVGRRRHARDITMQLHIGCGELENIGGDADLNHFRKYLVLLADYKCEQITFASTVSTFDS